MWLSLVFVGLIIAVAFKQATQGMFSSLIMVVLTVCCAAAAIGSYEYVAGQWLAPMWKPEYALSISLAATFAVPLLILRVIFDKLVRRSCLLPTTVEKIGSGVLSLISALIIVGVAAIALQMMPFAKGSIIGFSRYSVVNVDDARGSEVDVEDLTSESGLWLSPDRFAAGLGSALLSGAMGSDRSFNDHHPDLLSTIGSMGAVPAGTATYAPAGAISVRAAHKIDTVYKMTPPDTRAGTPAAFEELRPASGKEFQMVRVRLGQEARDANMSHVFTLRQFRLVGVQNEVVTQSHAVAIRLDDASVDFTRHIRSIAIGSKSWPVLDNTYSPAQGAEVEVVFEVPVGFQPSFVEYRRGARAAVRLAKPAEPTTSSQPTAAPATEATASAQPTTPTRPERSSSERSRPARRPRRTRDTGNAATNGETSGPGARVRGAAAEGDQSIFGDDLPMTLTAYRNVSNVELSRGSLSSGHLVAEVDQQAGGADPPVRKFNVPRDKRLLQLRSTALSAGSTLGAALAQAVTTAQAYFVEDDRGQRYELAGKYVIADDNGTQVFEVQYFSEPVGSIGGIGKFSRVSEKDLKSEDTFVLLFLVDPGARIVSFSTGGAASRKDDLAAANLVAPQ